MDDFRLVQNYLLKERDRQMRQIFSVGQKEISSQLILDLYALPGAGGSDERDQAFQWLERSSNLFNTPEPWRELGDVIMRFSKPTATEIEQIAKSIRSRSIGRER